MDLVRESRDFREAFRLARLEIAFLSARDALCALGSDFGSQLAHGGGGLVHRSDALLLVLVECLLDLATRRATVAALKSPAANVSPAGYTNSFDALPAAADWATSSRAGGVADNYDMDLDIQTNIAATVVTTAITSSASDPAAASLRAVWSSTGLYVQTRPTGNRYTTLMGKFLNASGSNVAELVISYQLTFASTTIAEEPGRGTRV